MNYLSNRHFHLHNILGNGKAYILPFFIIFSLFFSLPAKSTSVYDQVVQDIVPNSITIIGEVHQRLESNHLFLSLIDTFLQKGKCLTVALEIASNQQPIIDEMMRGGTNVSNIDLPPMIDHPPFRALIDGLVEMHLDGACLKLKAIDAGDEKNVDRDEQMAQKLAEQVGQDPVLALLGNLHTLKKVDWNLAMTDALPYVGERLISQGFHTSSYAQIWSGGNCNKRNRFISAEKPEATRLIQKKLIALLNATETKKATDVVDGVILWECG